MKVFKINVISNDEKRGIMKNKKLMFIFVFICIIVFIIFYYIFSILGNNKNRNKSEIVDNILNSFDKYEADIMVKVTSNKTENYYNIYQIVENEYSKSIVNSPENIKGVVIELEKNNLKITNTKLNMEKIYTDYNEIMNNSLFLNVFSRDYKNNESKMYEQNEEIILETKLNNNPNTYIKYKELHLDKKTEMPKELIIKDNTKKTHISIIYNNIKIK